MNKLSVAVILFAGAWLAQPTWAQKKKGKATKAKPAASKPAPPAPSGAITFAQHIKPILEKNCIVCHSKANVSNAALSGGLSLQTYEDVLKEVTPGKSAESEIVKMVTEPNKEKRMPKGGNPLPQAQIDLIKKWIDSGAKSTAASGGAPAATGLEPAPPSAPQSVPFVKTEILLPVALAKPQGAQQPEQVSFSKQVLPIFAAKCNTCHSRDVRRGNLVLENYDFAVAGGGRGGAVVPGKSAESLLVKKLTGELAQGQGGRMPQGQDPLPQEQINLIKKWIDEGANPDPTPQTGPVAILNVGTPAPITALRFSPDGKWLAVGGYQRVELWDLAEGKPIKMLRGHADMLHDLAFNGDGTLLAAAGGAPAQYGEVKIWDVKTGQVVKTIGNAEGDCPQCKQPMRHGDVVYGVAFSPDGKFLAAASIDKLVKVWDLSNDQCKYTLKDCSDAVYGVAFSNDTDPAKLRLVACSADKSLKMWGMSDGKIIRSFSNHSDTVYAVRFLPNGDIISAAADKAVKVWNPEDGKVKANRGGHGEPVHDVDIAKNSETVTASGDQTVRVWKADGGLRLTLQGHDDWVYSCAISPDGKIIASGSWDGQVKVWNAADGKLLATLISTTVADGKGKPLPEPEYLVITPEGYYDGSPHIVKAMQWRLTGKVEPPDKYEKTFRLPDTVKKALKGEKVDAVAIAANLEPALAGGANATPAADAAKK